MSDLMNQAVDLVVYGMGTVFVFLTVLVGCTMLMSWLVNQGGAAEEQHAAQLSSVDSKLLAAIGAAVKQYRQDH